MSLPTVQAPEVVVLGPSTWDHIVQVEQFPEPRPHTVFASASWETLGGTSAGKALHLADLGRPTRLFTPIADDEPGRRIRQALHGIDVHPLAAPASERHVNLMAADGGRLSIYATPPARAVAPDIEDLIGARAVVLDLADWTRELAAELSHAGVRVWCDLHDIPEDAPWHQPFVDAASWVQCSNDHLSRPLEFLRARVRDGVRLAVCTLGAEGAIAVDAQGEYRVPAVACEVVDTNGAGDGFFAGVLHAVLDGADTPVALDAGARQATRALTTRELGPLPGMS